MALNLALPRLPSLTRQTRKKSRTPSLIDKTTRDRRSTPHQLHCHAKLTPTRAKLVQRPSESSSMHLLLTLDLAAGRPDLQPPRLACNSSNIHHFFFCVKRFVAKSKQCTCAGQGYKQTNKAFVSAGLYRLGRYMSRCNRSIDRECDRVRVTTKGRQAHQHYFRWVG